MHLIQRSLYLKHAIRVWKHAGARLLYFPSATTEYLRWLIWVIQMPWAPFPCCPYLLPPHVNWGQHPAPPSQEAFPQPDTPFLLPLQSCTRSHSHKNPLNCVREARQAEKPGKNSKQCHVHRQEDSEYVHIADWQSLLKSFYASLIPWIVNTAKEKTHNTQEMSCS